MPLPLSRRGVLAFGALAVAAEAQEQAPSPLKMPKLDAPSEKESTDPPVPAPPTERVGFAVVGLGRLALEEILPAFGMAKHCKLAALVSGTPEKLKATAEHYGVPEKNCYSYTAYDQLRDNPDVQVIYIVLPNALHREYTVRGAKAGKHILCEKPMATSAAECEDMVRACKNADRKLMIAYRMQYEPYNREMIRMIRSGELGALKSITAENCQNQGDPGQWRLKKKLAGGGALPDIGLYCLNAARYLTGEEPVQVRASQFSTPGDGRFREVEESVSFSLQFPSGVTANCYTSYGVHTNRHYRVGFADGWADLDPAFAYEGLRMKIARKATEKAEDIADRHLQQQNQFALEMDHMAECVRQNRQPHTPGEEGLQDQRLMETIYRAAKEGRTITLPAVPGKDVFRGPLPQS